MVMANVLERDKSSFETGQKRLQNLRGHTEQKVHDNQLVGTTVVEPFIHGGGFPDWVEVHACSGYKSIW